MTNENLIQLKILDDWRFNTITFMFIKQTQRCHQIVEQSTKIIELYQFITNVIINQISKSI